MTSVPGTQVIGRVAAVLRASGVGATLRAPAIPRSAALQRQPTAWQRRCVLTGGDDYELLFTLPPERAAALRTTLQIQQRVTQIGVITADTTVHCLLEGQPFRIKRGGYDHFAAGEGDLA